MIRWLTITVDRIEGGREFQSTIHIGPDGYSQSGDELGETQPLAEAIFRAAADMLNTEED